MNVNFAPTATPAGRADPAWSRHAPSLPGVVFTLRREANGHLSLPLAAGRLDWLPDLTPEQLAQDLTPLLQRCDATDVAQMRAALDLSAHTTSPCQFSLRSQHPATGPRLWQFQANPAPADNDPTALEWHGFWSEAPCPSGRTPTPTPCQSCDPYLRTVLDHLPFAVWLKDPDGRLRVVNQAFADWVGMDSPRKVEGLFDADLFPQELADRYLAGDREMMATGQSMHSQEPFVTPQGDSRFVEAWKTPLRVNGHIVGTVGFLRDITEPKQTELRLAETHQRLRKVLHTLPDLVWLKDPNGTYLGCNHAFEEFFGAKEADIVGKTDHDFVNAELADFFRHKDQEAIEANDVCINEEWVTYATTGQRVLLETRKVPIHDTDGTVTGVLGIARDITTRKQTEQQLADAHWLLHSVLQGIPDPVWMKDPQGAFIICNAGMERLLNAKEKDIIGKTDADFLDAELAELFQSKDRTTLELNQPTLNEEWWTFADTGERALMETRKVPVKSHDGQVLGVLGVARDITLRKHIEETLAKREMEYRSLVENTPDTIARFDRNLRRTFANPALAAFYGQSIPNLLGKKAIQLPGGSVGEYIETQLMAILSTGQPTEFEYAWTNQEGVQTLNLVRATPEYNHQGAIESILTVGRDITELHQFRQKIHQMAYFDHLTGLPNRSLFNERLKLVVTDALQHGRSAGVMMIDMDRFKMVNDTMGHGAGDELLRQAAHRLTQSARSYDVVARLGGDEFAILLPEIHTEADLSHVAEKILTLFGERFVLEGKDIFISCSIGIALCPHDSHTERDLLKYADSAMYHAKKSGKNTFRFYDRNLTKVAQSRLAMESDLRQAMAKRELTLHFQPKVCLQTGHITGCEALIRWHHAHNGMVPPNQFIPIAEESGLIVDMGRWVLQESCLMAAALNTADTRPCKVAINLSPRQFQSPDLLTTIRDTLAATQCQPAWIELEITESLLLEESTDILHTLEALRAMGITMAIDDFGTGYSALSYLTRFPIDTLKIDRSFINSVTTDAYRAELVKAILSIARCLGQEVVAEGVETVEQAKFLAAHGCQTAQGYLFSPAIPSEQFLRLPPQLQACVGQRH
ncbi:hypothetical protein GCM10028785_00850 [Hydrogenophaga soli]